MGTNPLTRVTYCSNTKWHAAWSSKFFQVWKHSFLGLNIFSQDGAPVRARVQLRYGCGWMNYGLCYIYLDRTIIFMGSINQHSHISHRFSIHFPFMGFINQHSHHLWWHHPAEFTRARESRWHCPKKWSGSWPCSSESWPEKKESAVMAVKMSYNWL